MLLDKTVAGAGVPLVDEGTVEVDDDNSKLVALLLLLLLLIPVLVLPTLLVPVLILLESVVMFAVVLAETFAVDGGFAIDAGSVVTEMLVPTVSVPFRSRGFLIAKIGPQLSLSPSTTIGVQEGRGGAEAEDDAQRKK